MGSSSGDTIHVHMYQTATLTFTFSSAYNCLVSGFVGNTNIHPITQVEPQNSLLPKHAVSGVVNIGQTARRHII
jgi:hypothetical protein